MRRAGTAIAGALLAAGVGCSGSSSGPGAISESAPPMTPTTTAESCPDVTGGGGSYAAVDYVDFIQALGRQYVASTFPSANSGSFKPKATRADLGRVVLRSKCSFSALND